MTKTFKGKQLFKFSKFGHWDLFDICILVFEISIDNDQQSKSHQGITKSEPSVPRLFTFRII
jgi:hypothetical protein